METIQQAVAFRIAGVELAAAAFDLTMEQAQAEYNRAQYDSGHLSAMEIMERLPGRLQMLTGSRN